MHYVPKIYLKFDLPDGTTRSGFFRPNQKLGDILRIFDINSSRVSDADKTIEQLGLQNDSILDIKTDVKLSIGN